MPELIINLAISKEQYLKYYQGTASMVAATSLCGKSCRFPANILRPFVTRAGINGRFKLIYSSDGKFKDIICYTSSP